MNSFEYTVWSNLGLKNETNYKLRGREWSIIFCNICNDYFFIPKVNHTGMHHKRVNTCSASDSMS